MQLPDKVTKNLLKQYSPLATKLRRKLVNLYRPILHDRSTSKWNQHPIAYIMFALFTLSCILLTQDCPNHWIPFVSGWCFIPLSWIYLKLFPQTWNEMYKYEKTKFKQIWNLPQNWKPEH